MTSHQSVTVSHKSKIFRSHLSQSDVWQCHRRDVTLTLAPPETRCHCGAQVEISPLPVVPTLSSSVTTRWRLYCRHCAPHIIGGIIIIRMETSRHSGSQTFLSHLYILYSRSSAACLRTWHWPVMVKWLVSGSEKLSCSHTVMQSCSCSLLTLHCTRSRLLNKVSSDHYQGSMVLHWIFPQRASIFHMFPFRKHLFDAGEKMKLWLVRMSSSLKCIFQLFDGQFSVNYLLSRPLIMDLSKRHSFLDVVQILDIAKESQWKRQADKQ